MTAKRAYAAPVAQSDAAGPLEQRAVRRAGRRILWFVTLLYLLNNIDRTNVGFAALTMNEDIGLSTQAFGVAVGIFYLGYLCCEIPSNILLARAGARRSLARMAITSGLVTSLTAFIQGASGFYLLRFLLGISEAGYLVGIVYYLSIWFPAPYRARYNALFMLSMPIAFTLSSALAGAIMGLGGRMGLAGWQWLFLLEGMPAVVAGLVALRYLSDRPGEARWLSADEAAALHAAIARDAPAGSAAASSQAHPSVRAMLADVPGLLRNPVVLTCGLIYLALNFGLISLTSWTPLVIRTFGLPVTRVGFLTMIAPIIAAVVMLFWGRYSDRTQERAGNTSLALLLGAAGWALAALAQAPAVIFAGIILAAIGVYASYALSFTMSQTYIAPASRPVAIAMVGVIGNIGGVFVPMIVGYFKARTGNFTIGFLIVAAIMALASGCTWRLGRTLRRLRPDAG